MNKPELIAALNELSGKLGRELRTEGSNAELQARLDEGLMELRLLEEEGGDVLNTSDDDASGTPKILMSENTPATSGVRDDLRRVRLLTAMHIKHYHDAGTPDCPELMQRLRGLVSKNTVILVKTAEAERQISLGHMVPA